MHELSFAQQILESVVREAEEYPGHKVIRIKMRAADALALEPASLRFCLEAIAVGTVAEGAAIEFEETSPEIECPRCGRGPAESRFDAICPQCGAAAVIVASTDLVIEEIELNEHDG